MKRIRINNDFTFVWAIERNGLPEYLSTAINMVLRARNARGVLQSITDYTVAGNMVSIEVTPDIANVLGKYNFILTYELPDAGLSDLERLCEIDTDAFILVPRTAEADDAEDLLVTSDMAIGFKGDSAYQVWLDEGNVGTVEDYLEDIKGDSFLYSDFTPEQLEALKVKGDPFLYEDFTPEQIAELQRPATDAAIAVNEAEALRMTAEVTRVGNEQGRVTAEGTRQQNEIARGNSEDDREDAEALRLSAEVTRLQNEQARITAEGLRVTAESTRQTNTATAITNANNAATNANTKAGLADTAASNANTKAGLANDAAILANEKAELANTAATNADNARLAIQTDLGLKLDKSAVKQVKGTSLTDVMSQKAVTDEIAKRSGLIYEYVHSDNIEISGFTVDLATGTFTKASHGLSDGDELRTCLNQNTTTLLLKDVTFAEYIATASMIRYVVNATANTFQLSRTIWGAVETLTAVAGTDLTKWHFEKQTSGGATDSLAFEGINALSGNAKNIRVVVTGKIVNNGVIGHLFFNIDDKVTDTKYIAYSGSGAAAIRSTHTLLRADGFGTVEYDCTYNGNNLVIRKNLLMIKERDLAAYTENQLFYKNNTTYTLNIVRFAINGFTNGLTIQIYKQ